MKKLLLIITISLFASAAHSQTSTSKLSGLDADIASYTDTLKNFTYHNVYMIVTGINIGRGNSFPFYTHSAQFTNSVINWKGRINTNFYTSKSDYQAGKQFITQANISIELTDSYPTQEAIMTKLLQNLPK
jgi:hypothetical protein